MIFKEKDIDRGEWSRLVETSATGTWFQGPEAYEFFASMPELFMPFVVGVENDQSPMTNDKSRLRAVCVGYVTKERSVLKQFFTRRAIIIGGPALADDATDEEVEALMTAVKNLSFTHFFILLYTSRPVTSTTILVGKMLLQLRDLVISRISTSMLIQHRST